MTYGTGTRSYNRSAEAREMKRQQKQATLQYEEAKARGEVKAGNVPLLCTCASWDYPHELSAHKQLRAEYDWPTPEERIRRQQNVHEWERAL
jgi:hypothetical protein